MKQPTRLLSESEVSILKAAQNIAAKYPKPKTGFSVLQQDGWVTSARVREELGARSLETRQALKKLAVDGFLESLDAESVTFYRLNLLGERYLKAEHLRLNGDNDEITVSSSSWTGLVAPVQVVQVLAIVSEIEDVAEEMTDNTQRVQVMGLVTALKVLLDLPEPPRQGIVALARDPAFANIIQLGTFLAAIIAAVKA